MKIYVDKDGKRINTHAAIVYQDTVYNGNVLQFPQVVEALGLHEIEVDDTPPAEYLEHPDFYTVNELDEAPFVKYNRKNDAQITRQVQEKVNEDSLAYLKETDWMVTRFSETGVPIPDDVKAKRQACRDAIVPLTGAV